MSATIEVMAANLTATMKCFARAHPAGSVTEHNGLALIDAGPDLGFFNTALLTARVETEQELASKAAAAATYFKDRQANWCCWICEGLLAAAPRRRLRHIMKEHDLHAMASSPGLAAASLRAPSRSLPVVSVRAVSDCASRQSFCHIMTLAFDGPQHQIATVYGSPNFWGSRFQGFLGTVDGQDVCAGATVAAEGAIGIYAIATLPSLTRNGYGEALIREAIAQTMAEHGPQPLVLQSSIAALGLYRRLGFEPVTTFSVFTT